MDIKQAVKQVASKFLYQKDKTKLFDSWRIMNLHDGRYRGDCEDFMLTCFWYYSDKNLARFLWHTLVTHRYKMYVVKTARGEYHAVGCVEDLWFDNFVYEAVPKEEFLSRTRHKILMRCISPLIGILLLLGFIFK